MPGSARRLKKKLQEAASPSPSSSQTTSPQPGSPKSGSLADGISSLLHPHSHHHKSHSTGQGLTSDEPVRPTTSATSADSVGSNPNDYLTDQQLEQDLAMEEMAERQSIGHPPPPLGAGGNRPPPPAKAHDLSHSQSAPPQLPPSGSTAYPAPPPPVDQGKSGGMYGGNLWGNGGNSGGSKKKSSKQKFAERQARKKDALLNSAPPSDPDWTAQLEKERQEEIQVIGNACDVLGREIYEISPDGHCMFNSISDQLYLLGLIPTHQAGDPRVIRQMAAQYMRDHKDDFIAFLPSVGGEDTAEATSDGMMTDKGFQKYCRLVAETGEWGGEPEIQALSRAFRIPIHVIQRGPPTIVSHGGTDDAFGGAMTPEQSLAQGERVVRISYHRRMYGLGEHYNSLRRA